MSDESTSFEELKGPVRTLQTIVIALAMGVAIFGGIAIAMAPLMEPNGVAIVSLTMGALAAAFVGARLIVPGIYVAQGRRRIASGTWSAPRQYGYGIPETDVGKLAALLVTKTIISAAILEGAAMANLVAYLLEGQLFSLIIAGAMLIGILSSFPVGFAASGWVEDQLRRIDEQRRFRRMEG